MNKLLVIAHREYAAMVATKAFVFSLVMMPILMFGGMILMPKLSQLGGSKTRRIIVVDHTKTLFEGLQAACKARNDVIGKNEKPKGMDELGRNRSMSEKMDFIELESASDQQVNDAQRLQWSNQIRDGKLYAFIEIPETALDVEQAHVDATFVSQDALLSSERQWMSSVLQEMVRSIRLKALGVDTSLVAKGSVPFQLKPTQPYREGEDGKASRENPENVLVTLLLPFGIMMLMFMVIFLAAQPMLESGMEEKNQRIAEVLLGAVHPTELMAGKLLGNVAGSLMIVAIYGIGGWLVADTNGWTKNLNWSLLPWFVVFQILGVLFFSSIFLTVGASISELKEAQSILMPVWMLLVAPIMVWFVALRDPNGPVAVTLSFFPPSSPLMMILRLASGQTIPAWQPPLAAVLLVCATLVVVILAGRIYRASLLRTDSARTFAQILGRLR
ncbi:MAG: ABC transporter permease [Pirellulales bacterium]